jgi:dTMP kinase
VSTRKFYGNPLPGVNAAELKGKLIVIEGADGSGRSTQTRILTDWLERQGHATVNVGLRRSTLVSEELNEAKQGNVLGHTTMSLFYATDFFDQFENVIVPALRAGFVVLADRYIYTLMVRDIVRGANREWVESLYSIALVPDLIFYLRVAPHELVVRTLQKSYTLDFWESGMDIGLARDRFESFMTYQKLVQREFVRLEKQYGFFSVNGNRAPHLVAGQIRGRVEELFGEPA